MITMPKVNYIYDFKSKKCDAELPQEFQEEDKLKIKRSVMLKKKNLDAKRLIESLLKADSKILEKEFY